VSRTVRVDVLGIRQRSRQSPQRSPRDHYDLRPDVRRPHPSLPK
jgi:hypothetical protein